MIDTLVHRIGEDMLPFPVEKFFTAQRAPDGMWFGDELPPTLQDTLNDPQVQQAKWLFKYQVAMATAKSDRNRAAQAHRNELVQRGRRRRT